MFYQTYGDDVYINISISRLQPILSIRKRNQHCNGVTLEKFNFFFKPSSIKDKISSMRSYLLMVMCYHKFDWIIQKGWVPGKDFYCMHTLISCSERCVVIEMHLATCHVLSLEQEFWKRDEYHSCKTLSLH